MLMFLFAYQNCYHHLFVWNYQIGILLLLVLPFFVLCYIIIFQDVSKPLHQYSWYQTLLQAGTDKVGFDLENSTIVGLIPAIIDKLFFPRLTSKFTLLLCLINQIFLEIIHEQWDPYSLSQSRNLSYFISTLIDEAPTLTAEAKSVKNLLKALMVKFKATIEGDTFVPLYGKE